MFLRRSILCSVGVLVLLVAAQAQAQAVVTTYTNANDLDLSGVFIYALDIGASDSLASQTVNGLTFVDDDSPTPAGVITATSDNNNFSYQLPNYTGGSDVQLEAISNSIRWDSDGGGTFGDVSVDLAVVAGQKYKLQLFWQDDASGNRGTDILIDGNLLLDNLPQSTLSTNIGKLVTYEFIAPDSILNIDLDGTATPFVDKNAILSGLTLELAVPEPSTWIMLLIGAAILPCGLVASRNRHS